MSNAPSPGAGRNDPGKGKPAGPQGEIGAWLRFVWATLSQVDGFVPKLKAIGRMLAILRRR